ncbi:MAG: hypothetical protein Q6361_01485 [Candidatus Hermodarchaeota archaeon]|nr:hypothetical protein [Candidatus Hermodarchaeota archaeon]
MDREQLESVIQMWKDLAHLCDINRTPDRSERVRSQLEGMAAAFRNCAAYLELKIAIHCKE